MSADKFDAFLDLYHAKMLSCADTLLDIMRDEIDGVYVTVVASKDTTAVRRWDEFFKFVEGPAAFEEKFKRYEELKSEACGLPAGVAQ